MVTWILLKSCSAGLTTVVLIGQELSTPFLNTFLLLRAYRGMGSLLTQGTFLLFALLFFATRVFMNSYGTFYFIREVSRTHTCRPRPSPYVKDQQPSHDGGRCTETKAHLAHQRWRP